MESGLHLHRISEKHFVSLMNAHMGFSWSTDSWNFAIGNVVESVFGQLQIKALWLPFRYQTNEINMRHCR